MTFFRVKNLTEFPESYLMDVWEELRVQLKASSVTGDEKDEFILLAPGMVLLPELILFCRTFPNQALCFLVQGSSSELEVIVFTHEFSGDVLSFVRSVKYYVGFDAKGFHERLAPLFSPVTSSRFTSEFIAEVLFDLSGVGCLSAHPAMFLEFGVKGKGLRLFTEMLSEFSEGRVSETGWDNVPVKYLYLNEIIPYLETLLLERGGSSSVQVRGEIEERLRWLLSNRCSAPRAVLNV